MRENFRNYQMFYYTWIVPARLIVDVDLEFADSLILTVPIEEATPRQAQVMFFSLLYASFHPDQSQYIVFI